jgi:dihydrofolate reductase
MRKLTYSFMVSLDGFIETPDHSLDWQIIDEELHRYVNDQQAAIDTYLYGRRIYELMAEFWPTADEDPANPAYVVEFARIWKQMPKVVFSKTLARVEGNARLVREDAVAEITRLKQQPGKDLTIGGPSLAADCIRSGLVDEYEQFIHPEVLGSGTPMFPALEIPIPLRLVETHRFASGVVFLRYQRE